MQKRPARVGFDETPTTSLALDDVQSALAASRTSPAALARGGARRGLGCGSAGDPEDAIGDLLFAVVALARRLRVNPEEALRGRAMRFASRFRALEAQAREDGVDLHDLDDADWRERWERTAGLIRPAIRSESLSKPRCGPSYADTRRHIVPFVSDGAEEEERVIRPTPRPALDSPITLRRIAVVLIAGICGLVAFAVYGQVAQSRHLDAQVTALTAQNSSLTQQISERQREIADAQTVAWLEQEARQLGYIFPGEQLYVVVPPGAGTPASGRRVGAGPGVQGARRRPTPTPSPSPRPTPDADSDARSPSPTPTPTPTPTPH